MFDVSEIAAADAAKIIATQEGHFADVKDIRIKPAKLTRTVSAFSNASGGEILLGPKFSGEPGGAQREDRPSYQQISQPAE